MSEQTFPQPTDPVAMPLTLEGTAKYVELVTSILRDIDDTLAKAVDALVARVAAIEERLGECPNAVISGINMAVVTESDILESLRKENEQLRAEVAQLKEENEQLQAMLKISRASTRVLASMRCM